MEKVCSSCKKSKQLSEFHRHSRNKSGVQGECISCQSQRGIVLRKSKKMEIILQKGAKCSKCGYSQNIAALHFHHPDPTVKEEKFYDKFGRKESEWESTLIELEKCILLCANCHAEYHNPDYDIENISNLPIKKKCLNSKCSNMVTGRSFCSTECFAIYRGKIESQGISIDTLLSEMKTMSWRELGEKYGTSGTSIRKYLKKHGEHYLKEKVEFLSFNDARSIVRSWNLKTKRELDIWIKDGKKPLNIPANPRWVYSKKGWNGYEDWLGTKDTQSNK